MPPLAAAHNKDIVCILERQVLIHLDAQPLRQHSDPLLWIKALFGMGLPVQPRAEALPGRKGIKMNAVLGQQHFFKRSSLAVQQACSLPF